MWKIQKGGCGAFHDYKRSEMSPPDFIPSKAHSNLWHSFSMCVVSIKMCGAYYAEEEDGVGADCCKTKWIPFAVIDKGQ